MSQFLRDESIKNVTIGEYTLNSLNEFFLDRALETNNVLGGENAPKDKILLPSYIIRFDNKGYRLYDFKDVLKFYSQAGEVERIFFVVDSYESVKTNRVYGTYLELKLDAKDLNNCYLLAAGDDGNWVDSAFSGVVDLLKKSHNKNNLIRNTWTQFLVQIFGVAIGFLLSLLAGAKIAPHLSIENSFVISFLFAFLIFSNAWGFINQQILRLLNFSFPNLRFKRSGRDALHWLVQALIGGIIVAFTIFLLSKSFDLVGRMLGELVTK